MLFFDGGLAIVAFAIWVFCVIDVITTPSDGCRNLPKLVWLFIVILLPDVGSIAWLVAGHSWVPKQSVPQGAVHPSGHPSGHPSAYGRRVAGRPSNPDDDEEFLATLRARAEEQRRRAREDGRGDGGNPGAGPGA